ncbi:hypothetical protein J6590_108637 [Homalodisca vitripennis]|nr:hypothetical protein J6590_108637 [Homalodisca vitripennis]
MSHGIVRIPLPPTRITSHSETSIDIIATNLMPTEEIDTAVLHTSLSDHTGQICKINLEPNKAVIPRTSRRYFNARNLQKLKRILARETWEAVLNKQDADQAYTEFNKTISEALDTACPIVNSRRSKRKNINTNQEQELELMRLKGAYTAALNKSILMSTVENKKQANDRKKEYDLLLKNLKKETAIHYIANAENQTRAVWQIINNNRYSNKSQKNYIKSIDIEGSTITDPQKIAEHMNHFFANAAEQVLSNSQQAPLKIPPTIHESEFVSLEEGFRPTNRMEIDKTISFLKSKPSSGIDEVSSTILKHCKTEVITPIIDVINKSFQQGIFPSQLKHSLVYPKYKKGPTSLASNYRPISLICTLSKIFEKIVLSRLLTHLENNSLLTNRQHGFRRGKSTITAIIDLVETIIDASEEGATTTGILLDFSKAFDSLSHKHLLEKLKALGIRGVAHQWFQSYLSGRTQMTEITQVVNNRCQKFRSTQAQITRGVPQGSVLGPVLFILYTNDIVSTLQDNCEIFLYADDTALIVSHKNVKELEIKAYIAACIAKQYSQENDLVLNEEKTQQLFFGPQRRSALELPNVSTYKEAKYLGITLDGDLNWKPHVDQLCKKLSTALYVIKRLKQISNTETSRTAYFALFESQMRYGLTVWGFSSLRNLHRVLLLQKKAIRIMAELGFRDSCRGMFKRLKLQTVANLYIGEVITYAVNKGLVQFLDTHPYNTRNRANYRLPAHHLTAYEKKPSYIGARLFNILPPTLKEQKSNRNFKEALLDWLLDKEFYSVEECLQIGRPSH